MLLQEAQGVFRDLWTARLWVDVVNTLNYSLFTNKCVSVVNLVAVVFFLRPNYFYSLELIIFSLLVHVFSRIN